PLGWTKTAKRHAMTASAPNPKEDPLERSRLLEWLLARVGIPRWSLLVLALFVPGVLHSVSYYARRAADPPATTLSGFLSANWRPLRIAKVSLRGHEYIVWVAKVHPALT